MSDEPVAVHPSRRTASRSWGAATATRGLAGNVGGGFILPIIPLPEVQALACLVGHPRSDIELSTSTCTEFGTIEAATHYA